MIAKEDILVSEVREALATSKELLSYSLSEINETRLRLGLYGSHRTDCAILFASSASEIPCSCGWTKTLLFLKGDIMFTRAATSALQQTIKKKG